MIAPWEEHSHGDDEGIYADFITSTFGEYPLVVFPIRINVREISVNGVLYIPDRADTGLSTGNVDVYIRKMLVKENDNLLLPEWASFIRGMIDCPQLSPNSARDGFSTSDNAYKKLREHLDKFIYERLIAISKGNSEMWLYIYVRVGDSLKSAAIRDIGFFDKFSNHFLFASNRDGLLYTLPQYLSMSPTFEGKTTVYYCTDKSLFGKLKELDSSDKLILDATSPLDERLLSLYSQHHSNINLNCVDQSLEQEVFTDLSDGELKQHENLLHSMQRFINMRVSSRIIVEIKRMSNKAVISTMLNTSKNKAEELWRNLLLNPSIAQNINEVWNEYERIESVSTKKLVLNSRNEFVERMATSNMESSSPSEVIYKAFLYNAYLQIVDEDDHRYGIKNLINDFLAETFKLINKKQPLAVSDTLVNTEFVPFVKNEHVKMFLIFPSNGYDKIEQAVRMVFENPPFFFEIATASDYMHKAVLTDNVKEHIRTADAFIAEISDLDANVMMEVGAILISGDSRSLFSLRSQNAKPLPQDISSNLYIQYTNLDVDIKTLANEIKNAIIRDGKLRYADINSLLASRKKRYLSRTLLDGEALPIKLSSDTIDTILRRYKYVEDVLADELNFASKLGMNENFTKGVFETLKGFTHI